MLDSAVPSAAGLPGLRIFSAGDLPGENRGGHDLARPLLAEGASRVLGRGSIVGCVPFSGRKSLDAFQRLLPEKRTHPTCLFLSALLQNRPCQIAETQPLPT